MRPTAVRAVRADSRAIAACSLWERPRTLASARGGTPAYVKALDDVVIAIMVEKRERVENIDAILSVPGLDMVQFGPGDYAMSIGHPGEFRHPEVLRAERTVIEAALKKGLHRRAEIPDASQAARYLEMGVKHFCMGSDVHILHGWWRDHGKQLRDALDGVRRG